MQSVVAEEDSRLQVNLERRIQLISRTTRTQFGRFPCFANLKVDPGPLFDGILQILRLCFVQIYFGGDQNQYRSLMYSSGINFARSHSTNLWWTQ